MNSDVDVIALQQKIEDVVREEYAVVFAQLQKEKDEFVLRKAGWDAILGRLVEHYKGPLTLADFDHLEQFLERLDVIVKLGLDFEKIIKAIETNDLVKANWDKLLMAMRLSGMDNSASVSHNE